MRRATRLAICAGITAGTSNVAGAQELTQRFISPGFGGNPFNSDYLLATATAQRPERRADPSETAELTEAQLFARQIQSRLLSALSSSLVEAITGAQPGTSGEFVVGDQTISFERTLAEIRLTIRDNNSGEVTTIAVPVLNFNNPSTSPSGPAGAPQSAGNGASAEAMIAGSSLGSLSTRPLDGGSLTASTGSLESPLKSGF